MATAEESNKRIRIDSMANNDEKTTDSPMSVATKCLTTHCESLHKSAQKILLPLGLKHLKLISKRFHKQQELNRLEKNPSIIPRSARFGFTLTGEKGAEDFDEFHRVSEEVKAAVLETQRKFRDLTVKGLIALIKFKNKEIEKDMARGMLHLIETIRISQKKNLDTTTVASDLINQSFDKISTNFQSTRENFINTFNETNNVVLPQTLLTQVDATNTDNAVILRWLDSIFIAPFSAYIRQYQNNQISHELEELHSELSLSKKTDDARMIIDEELPADRIQLNELIQREATKQTQALRQELNTLKNKMAKNTTTGGSKRSASKEKNKSRSPSQNDDTQNKDNAQQETNKKKKGKRKAAAHANVSSSNNGEKKQNGSKKKSNKKNPNSQTA